MELRFVVPNMEKTFGNLWFAGFYPAQQPRYTIVVLQDGQVSTEHSSAAIFARLCAMLDLLA